MKLNDPFGRMENRHQRGYEAMRDTLHRCGIKTPEAALEIIRQSKKRAQHYITIAVAVFLLTAVLWSNAIPVTLSLVLFFTVWVITSAINGQRYIRRYIDEELSGDQTQENDA